jgi:hypothetical protein
MHFNEKPEVVAINWEGFEARAEGVSYAVNPYATDPFKRALWSKGWCDREHGRLAPETAFDAYWIVDDALDGRAREGFQVFYGCPFRAIGTRQGEHLQLGLALASVPEAEPVYRVRLARRHGKHSVVHIRGANGTAKGRVERNTLAIRDPGKVFDQTKVTWESELVTALEKHGELDHSDAASLHEVHFVLAETLFNHGTDPGNTARQILAQPIRKQA